MWYVNNNIIINRIDGVVRNHNVIINRIDGVVRNYNIINRIDDVVCKQ